MSELTTDTLHPFEKAGLGKAPFVFRGMETKVGPIHLADGVTQIGAPGQPMGTCDYCGQGIAHCCNIRSADGKRFIVGIDCVEKLYKRTNRKATAAARDPLQIAVRKARNDLCRKARHKKEEAEIREGEAWAEANESTLRATPSVVRDGESLWDRFLWYRLNAGNAGQIRLIRELRRRLELSSHASPSASHAT